MIIVLKILSYSNSVLSHSCYNGLYNKELTDLDRAIPEKIVL